MKHLTPETLTAIHLPPWTQPLDWSMQVNSYNEPRVPFSHSVRLEQTLSNSATFLPFCNLPAELQLQVLCSCDRPTLYALMKVSSALRVEAKKLFWSIPDAWYHIEGLWLLRGGFSGQTEFAVDFMAHVEQIEIDFDNINMLMLDWGKQHRSNDHSTLSWTLEHRINEMWRVVHARFPKAKCVVVSECTPRQAEEPLPHNLDMILHMKPVDIQVSVSILRYSSISGYLERSLWRQTETGTSLEDSNCAWQNIMPPPKLFHGPVGVYQQIQHRLRQYMRQRRAIRIIAIEAMERRFFEKRSVPFECINAKCEARFEKPGEWTVHAVTTRHDRLGDTSILSEEFKKRFSQHVAQLRRFKKQQLEALDDLRCVWGKAGSDERRIAEHAFLDQLENDPCYAHGRAPRECSTWHDFRRHMGSLFED